MFFRQKKSGDRVYLQIVENVRAGGRVAQRVIATIGRMDELAASGALAALLASGAPRFLRARALVVGACRRCRGPPCSAAAVRALFGRIREETGCRAVIDELLAERGFEFAVERESSISSTGLRRKSGRPCAQERFNNSDAALM